MTTPPRPPSPGPQQGGQQFANAGDVEIHARDMAGRDLFQHNGDIVDLKVVVQAAPGDPPPAPPDPAVSKYLGWLRTQRSWLELRGVGGDDVEIELTDVYVPLKLAGHDEEGRYQGKLERRELCEDFELTELFGKLEGRPHALLLGRPGSGKTTALRKLAQQCLREGPTSLRLPPGLVPVFVRLRRFTPADLDRPLGAFVARELHEVSAGEIDAACAERLWPRGVLLLLDGLDEIAAEDLRAALCTFLRDELQREAWRASRVVVSSRFAGHDGVRVSLDPSFARCDVRPLNAEQVRTLVRKWFSAATHKLREKVPLAEARRQADALLAALEDPKFGLGSAEEHRLRIMYSTPLLLTLLCVVVQKGREIPRHRVAFYQECLEVLLSRWREAKELSSQPLAVDTAISLLRPLAYRLHQAGQREEVGEAELLEHIVDRLTVDDPAPILQWLYRDTGVLAEFAPGQYGFFHLGIQEYLAALHVASGGEASVRALAREIERPWWHEVARLVCSMPARGMFGPLMRELLAGPAVEAPRLVELLRACVLEAAEFDVTPFLERLELATETPSRKTVLLGLLLRRREPALLACATRLRASARDAGVRAMAERVIASATRPAAGGKLRFDAALVVAADDLPRANELAGFLREHDLQVWPEKGPLAPAGALVAMELHTSVRVVVVAVGAADPWPESQALLRIFQKTGRLVIGVRLPGARARLGGTGGPSRPPAPGWGWWRRLWAWLRGLAGRQLPAAEPASGEAAQVVASWVDCRGGWEVEPLRALCGQILPAAADPARPAEPAAGEVWIEPVTKIRFVYVPAGRFVMGSDEFSDDEKPVHAVRLSAFWLGEVPVTNAQYGMFLAARKDTREPGYWRDDRFCDPSQPVVGVSWGEARAFCTWLSETAGVKASLPSEAQWEYAARGTDGRRYPWGDAPPDATRACFNGSGATSTSPVGSFPAGRGPFGALDQAGNVWEWCEDVWNPRAYDRAPELLDPVNNDGDVVEHRVARGGSWRDDEWALATAFRSRNGSGGRYVLRGFRLVVSASRVER